MNLYGCLICNKQRGLSNQPAGGYIYSGKHFSICHAPLINGPLGTLFIESNRHFLDYADMNSEELSAFSALLSRVYHHLCTVTGALRIYQAQFWKASPISIPG